MIIGSAACGGVRTCSLSSVKLGRSRRLFATKCSAAGPTRKKEKEKVVVISGPTGAGKTRLALELAKLLNGEIISADSVQVYRGLDVGSAKPSPSDRKVVPHHLIDILHPSEEYSVGQFFEDARQATRSILDSGRVPIVTGGTGLYLRWFIYGKPDVPKASYEVAAEVYSELADLQKNEDWDAAVQLVVKAGDPKAQFLAANDWYRLRRSLEIIKSSGAPPSAFQVPYDSFRKQHDSTEANGSHDINSSVDVVGDVKSKDLEYDFYCFFLSSQRLELYKSISYRCEDMLLGDDGILTEARWLLDIGLLPNSNSATRAIGYRQKASRYYISCQSCPYEYILSMDIVCLGNFAKRQLTWFRNEKIYHWLDASKPLDKVLNFIYNAYLDKSETLVVPEWLKMRKDTNHREASLLKAYRTRNRHFVRREDCSEILEWIRKTQCETMSKV
ncbi:tRNA dimethylallyltransferase 9 [Morus notabilis]|uniref:tRNA dimethylallyltransferase n=1 Tax=Morus notabilis TaxID=981085 RepID=W9S7A3_9ROSA|nr:tRNA dimethylallyltransferase 9 [Morus notabilis]